MTFPPGRPDARGLIQVGYCDLGGKSAFKLAMHRDGDPDLGGDRPPVYQHPPRCRKHRLQWSLVGDAELDEGAVWETVLDPMVAEFGEIVWIVDLNRQSLDRVVPTSIGNRLQGMLAANQSNGLGRPPLFAFGLPAGASPRP